MKSRKEVSYLRLLPTHLLPRHESDTPPTTEAQLSLPYLDPYTIVLANVEACSASQFEIALRTIKPRWIVDARVAPRFDDIAGTRSNAFRAFGAIGATYIDLFGQLGLFSYRDAAINPEFWGSKLFHMIKASNDARGPFLILLENKQLLEASKSALGSKCSAVFDRRAVPSIVECGGMTLAFAG